MENAEIKKCRPFHETVVDEILVSSDIGLGILSKLIKKTSIPKGHDEMLAAWRKRVKEVGLTNDLGVSAHILSEKARAEAEAKKRAEEERVNDQFALQLTRHQIDDIELRLETIVQFPLETGMEDEVRKLYKDIKNAREEAGRKRPPTC